MARSFSGRYPATGQEALTIFGVIAHDEAQPVRLAEGECVVWRDIAGITASSSFRRVEASPDAVATYRKVVEAVHAERAIVPAPFGTVFRSKSALTRWMELHYLALRDALDFVRGRSELRARMRQAETTRGSFESTVFDSWSFLKRGAVAHVVNDEGSTSESKEASFLVDNAALSAFTGAVEEEQARLSGFALDVTGPWPPYDFVRLQFGA